MDSSLIHLRRIICTRAGRECRRLRDSEKFKGDDAPLACAVSLLALAIQDHQAVLRSISYWPDVRAPC